MKKARTCERCKALDSTRIAFVCHLGYNIDGDNMKPLEPCPKPTTFSEYIKTKHKE